MICPECDHDNIEGVDYCANCGHDLYGLDQPDSPGATGFQANIFPTQLSNGSRGRSGEATCASFKTLSSV